MDKPRDKYKDYMIAKHKSEYPQRKKSWSSESLKDNPTWEQMELDLGITFPTATKTNSYPKFPKSPYTVDEYEKFFFNVLAPLGWKNEDGEFVTLVCKICDDRIMTIERHMIGTPKVILLREMAFPSKWIGKHNLVCSGVINE